MVENKAMKVEKPKVDVSIHQELRSGNWFVPATDVVETPDKFILVMDMPGVCADCAHVSIIHDELVVTGHVTHGEDDDDYVLYREYDVGHYHRHFGLPATIDQSKIEAMISNGVLTVTLPKSEDAKPRRVPIRPGG